MIAAGTTIGSYRVTGLLGQGGMGAVYIAEHTLLGRKAALKVLLPMFSSHEDVVRRFFNEARAVTEIADPGIVQVFDFGHDATGSAYIVMELLAGESLAARLARLGRLSPLETVRLARLASMSLAAAHAKGVVHRDLKPENIYIVADPAIPGGERPKILDFGIAKLSRGSDGTHQTQTGAVIGTPMYMSPEQCRGAGDVDQRSDIYSLACVILAMVTGRPPFEGAGTGDLIVAHLQQPPPLAASCAPGVPASLDALLQRCLAKQPADRCQTMTELAQALAVIEYELEPLRATPPAGYPVAAATPRPFATPTQPTGLPPAVPTTLTGAASSHATVAPRRRVAVIAAVASIVIAGGIVAMLLVTRGSGPPSPAHEPPAPPPAVVPPASAPADAAVVPMAADAASLDAPATVESKPDAAVRHPHSTPAHPSGGKHVDPSMSDVDRGD